MEIKISMKKYALIVMTLVSVKALSQNTFPASGNVGIGTIAPQAQLHLFNNNEALQLIEGSNPYIYAGLQFSDLGQTTAGKVKNWAIWAGRDGGTWLSGLGFHRYDAVNACAGGICDLSLFLHDNGNVGIGTGNPQEKLDVNGNIRSKKLIVTQTGWSDYVFDSSYQLKPLTDLEQFVKANKHLPDIPSAKQVGKDGIDVGENQALLLKKIEELTLYMIEQQKQITDLLQRNKDQLKENNLLKGRITKLENKYYEK